MRRIPPIHCLATFDVLARVRSVKLAATELCVSPSAVSHRMKLLESILDIPLFHDEYSLTTEGQFYLRNVRASLKLLSENVNQSEVGDDFVFKCLNQVSYCLEHT